MTGYQVSFDLSDKETRKKKAPELARKMIAFLAVKRDWTTRAQFRESLGMTDRECRLGREGSHGRILQGQKGYKLLRDATPAEVRATAGNWISQIKACQDEYALLMRRAHSILNNAYLRTKGRNNHVRQIQDVRNLPRPRSAVYELLSGRAGAVRLRTWRE